MIAIPFALGEATNGLVAYILPQWIHFQVPILAALFDQNINWKVHLHFKVWSGCPLWPPLARLVCHPRVAKVAHRAESSQEVPIRLAQH